MVELRADVDEDRERLEAGKPQHRDEEPRLVTADAVAVVEGDVDIVRRIAWRRVLHRQSHVPHLLRDKLEDLLDRLQLSRLRRHRRVRLGEVRGAEVPVPLRNFGPVG